MSIDPKLKIFEMSNLAPARITAYQSLASQANVDPNLYQLVDKLFEIVEGPRGAEASWFSLMLSLATMPRVLQRAFCSALLFSLIALQEHINPMVEAIAAAEEAGDEEAKAEAIKRLERILRQGPQQEPTGGGPKPKLSEDVN